MYYLYKIELENNKFFLGITEKKPPKKATVVFKSNNQEEFSEIALVHHRNTVNNPNRVYELPEQYQKKSREKWHHDIASIEKIRQYRIGKQWDQRIKQKISNALKHAYSAGKREASRENLGQKFSKETREKMQEAHKNRRRFRCEHCGVVCAVNMYVRHHGDNCKMNW